MINESSLSKIHQYRQTCDTGAMATMRPNKTRAVARKEINWLISEFQKKGFVAIKTMGYYQGGSEQSLFVADPKHNGNLKETLMEYGKLFNQDTILFRPKGGKSRLIITRGEKFGNETKDSHSSSYGSATSANYSKIGGRTYSDTIDIDDDFWPESTSFDTIVKNVLGESILTRSIKNVMNESKDYLEIVVGDLYEWLMEIGSNSMLDEFKPQQIKDVIKMMLKKEKNLPQDDNQMASWCRKNEDRLIENLARATGDYFMSKDEFAKQQEEEELPKITVQGSEILYNKRGRACGIKIQVNDQGTVYMKRRGSHWEITDISKENDDQRVWDMVQSSLEKMAKKNPTTFIRLMRNRAYELPKFKPTTLGESVTVRGLEVTPQDIQRRTNGMTVAQIQQWLNAHDNTEYASMPDIVNSIENGESKEQMMGRAFGKVKTAVYSQLNLTEDNPQVDDIIMKHLKTAKVIPTTDTTVREFIDTFWADELKQFQQPKLIQQEQEETSDFDNRFAYRSDLKQLANPLTKKVYMMLRKEFGDSMWRQLGMDDCDEQGLISQINDYQKHYGITDAQSIVNKMLGRK